MEAQTTTKATCTKCGKGYKTERGMANHMLKVHLNEVEEEAQAEPQALSEPKKAGFLERLAEATQKASTKAERDRAHHHMMATEWQAARAEAAYLKASGEAAAAACLARGAANRGKAKLERTAEKMRLKMEAERERSEKASQKAADARAYYESL